MELNPTRSVRQLVNIFHFRQMQFTVLTFSHKADKPKLTLLINYSQHS